MPAGNEKNHELNGLTVTGGLAVQRPGLATPAYLEADSTGGLLINGIGAGQVSSAFNFAACIDPRTGWTVGTNGLNTSRSSRVIIPKSGTITNVYVFIAVQSGNIDVGIYDTATTRNKLYSTGSIACPAVGWQSVGTANIAVTADQQLDTFIATSDATVSIGRVALGTAGGQLPSGLFPSTSGGSPFICTGQASGFPLPSTFAEGSLTAAAAAPLILLKIA